MKILNLYSGIGGNRKLWRNEHEIVAIENDKNIAKIYQEFFPNDKVIIDDAHDYLLKHFSEYDFIWSSPPCPSHSKIRKVTRKPNPAAKPRGDRITTISDPGVEARSILPASAKIPVMKRGTGRLPSCPSGMLAIGSDTEVNAPR